MAANRGVIPPIPALRAAGCPIAHGTDNNTNDVFEVMRVALLTERISRNDPNSRRSGRSPRTCSRTTREAARARCSRQKTLGSLEVGRKADLIVARHAARRISCPPDDPVSAWIHNGQPSDIESAMVDGQFIMRDRKVLTMDEDAIVAEADKVGRRIWNKVPEAGPLGYRAARARDLNESSEDRKAHCSGGVRRRSRVAATAPFPARRPKRAVHGQARLGAQSQRARRPSPRVLLTRRDALPRFGVRNSAEVLIDEISRSSSVMLRNTGHGMT